MRLEQRTTSVLASAFAIGSLLSSTIARADPDSLGEPLVDRPTDVATDHSQIDRTWLYGDDARIPLPLSVIATSSFSYTNIGNSPTRISYPQPNLGPSCVGPGGQAAPCYSGFGGNTAQPGGAMLLGGELGLLPRTSVQGNVMVGVGGTPSGPSVGATAALRFQVLPDSWRHLHLVLSGGYIREAWSGPVFNDETNRWLAGSPGGDNGAFVQAAVSGDIGRLRLAGTVHGEHIFAEGRDPLDMMVDLGASWRIAGSFRGGVEYVGQDLEEAFSPGAEGGARHFLGPIASVQLLHERLTIVGGPSVGLSRLSPDFVARVGASLGF
jgi:hypothetical protein